MNSFAALADPTRARIVEALAERERTAGEIGAFFTMTQPAVSQHLRVLREAGLVKTRRDAQRRIYSLNPAPLEDIDRWLGRFRRFWARRLDDLEQFLDNEEMP
jgi:DNA-binding transcriptional ArsR family regulator